MERCNVPSRGRREPRIVGQDSRSEGAHGGEAKPLIDISTFPSKLVRANKLLQFDNATTKCDSSIHTVDTKVQAHSGRLDTCVLPLLNACLEHPYTCISCNCQHSSWYIPHAALAINRHDIAAYWHDIMIVVAV